jgi:hypothetical protein
MNTLCRGGCGTEIFMAKHERTGKPAPLCWPPKDIKPNIEIFTKDGETYYRITNSTAAEFINHFGNCPKAAQFRPSPTGDK